MDKAEMVAYLRGVSRYPVPRVTLEEIAGRRGERMELARADVLVWLSRQPNVSQGGQSYSFTSEERRAMLGEARGIYKRYGDAMLESVRPEVDYGYRGEWL